MPTTFGIQAGQAAINAGSGILGSIMGLALGGYNDRRQIMQQERLNNLATRSNKEMADYNLQNQLKLWEQTNYSAQKAQLEKAGLNPALLYGMSGGGGLTAAAAQGQGVSQGHAPSGGNEIMGLMGMNMQSQMNAAQIEVLKSQANLNNTEAAKKGGVDTQLTNIQITQGLQNIQNAKAQEYLTKMLAYQQAMQNQITANTLTEQSDQIRWNAQRALTELERAENETYISTLTKQDQIRIIQQQAIEGVLRNALTKQQTAESQSRIGVNTQAIKESQSRIGVNEQSIKESAANILQKWETIGQGNTKLAIETFVAEFNAKHPGLLNTVGGQLDEAINNIYKLFSGQPRSETNIK